MHNATGLHKLDENNCVERPVASLHPMRNCLPTATNPKEKNLFLFFFYNFVRPVCWLLLCARARMPCTFLR